MEIKSFDSDKALAVLLYTIKKTGKIDYHKILKILYFAEQKHLSKYGCLMLNDTFIAMKNGHVASKIYNIFNYLKENKFIKDEYFKKFSSLKIIGEYYINAKEEPNLDYLSKSNILCIDESINENLKLNFNSLTKKSHDFAWENANRQNKIDILDIAKAGMANDELLKYINEDLENKSIKFY